MGKRRKERILRWEMINISTI